MGNGGGPSASEKDHEKRQRRVLVIHSSCMPLDCECVDADCDWRRKSKTRIMLPPTPSPPTLGPSAMADDREHADSPTTASSGSIGRAPPASGLRSPRSESASGSRLSPLDASAHSTKAPPPFGTGEPLQDATGTTLDTPRSASVDQGPAQRESDASREPAEPHVGASTWLPTSAPSLEPAVAQATSGQVLSSRERAGATMGSPSAAASTTPQELARQLAGFKVAPASSSSSPSPSPSGPPVLPTRPGEVASLPGPSPADGRGGVREAELEEEWHLKEIHWPPLPPTPSSSADSAVTLPPTGTRLRSSLTTDPGLKVKIICQNENGPCSLIALCTCCPVSLPSPCLFARFRSRRKSPWLTTRGRSFLAAGNILILRNDLHIPPGRESVTYSYLSNRLADYFLSLPAPASPTEPSQVSLSSVLSILPQTRYGLNLNPRFDRIDGFSPPSTSSASSSSPHDPNDPYSSAVSPPVEGDVAADELALFALARIPLLHGWLADPSYGSETHQVLLECGDYDSAMEAIVQGAEIAGGVDQLTPDGPGLADADEEELLRQVERRSRWTPEQEARVRKGE